MIRLLTAVLFFVSISVFGQDSTFVRETCDQIKKSRHKGPEAQINIVYNQSIKYADFLVREGGKRENLLQEVFRIEYNLNRELQRGCSEYELKTVPIKAQRVVDLENRLSKVQIDSLKDMLQAINTEKNIYLFVVTIDNYYPDKTITEFCNRTRDYWGMGSKYEKGGVLVAINFAKKEIQISTDSISAKYLKNSTAVVDKMSVQVNNNDYYKAILDGLNAIKSQI